MARRKTQQVEAVATSDASLVSAAPAEAALEQVTLPANDQPVVAVVEAPVVEAWKVVEAARASLYGQTVSLSPGKILRAAVYGQDALARLREQGVVLEPVA